jgi:hypothetical protein
MRARWFVSFEMSLCCFQDKKNPIQPYSSILCLELSGTKSRNQELGYEYMGNFQTARQRHCVQGNLSETSDGVYTIFRDHGFRPWNAASQEQSKQRESQTCFHGTSDDKASLHVKHVLFLVDEIGSECAESLSGSGIHEKL